MRTTDSKLARTFRRLRQEASGVAMVYTGLALAALVGFGGLAVDVSYWYVTKRTVQSATDAAALAGALEVARGTDESTMISMAKADAAKNGYAEGTYTVIQINNPPTSGDFAGDANAVEATIQQTVPGFLTRVFGLDVTKVSARAVARGFEGDSCLYVMNPTEDSALSVFGSSIVEMDCGAQVNSDSPISIDQTGSSCITATGMTTAGQASGDCLNPAPTENAGRAEDPFSHLAPPPAGPCTHTSQVVVNSSTTLDPGNYCGGLEIEGSINVTLNSGTYTVGGSGLQIQGSSTVTGDEVTFSLPSDVVGDQSGPTSDSIYIAGQAEVDVSAPTSGDYEGMLVYQEPTNDPDVALTLEGGADMNLQGIIYAPGNDMRYAGGNDQTDAWLVTFVDTIDFTGNSYIQGPDPSINLPFALVKPTLVE